MARDYDEWSDLAEPGEGTTSHALLASLDATALLSDPAELGPAALALGDATKELRERKKEARCACEAQDVRQQADAHGWPSACEAQDVRQQASSRLVFELKSPPHPRKAQTK